MFRFRRATQLLGRGGVGFVDSPASAVEREERVQTGALNGCHQLWRHAMIIINTKLHRLAASTIATLFATAICVTAAIGPGIAVA
jgi:hypothetical protein